MDVDWNLVLEDGGGVHTVGVVCHDAIELRVRDGRHGCHDDGREWVEVPLYLAQPSLILISGDTEV